MDGAAGCADMPRQVIPVGDDDAEFSGAFGAVLHAGFRGEERIGCIIKA